MQSDSAKNVRMVAVDASRSIRRSSLRVVPFLRPVLPDDVRAATVTMRLDHVLTGA